MRAVFTIIIGLVVVAVVGASGVDAQTQPAPFPWERETNSLLQPKKLDRLGHARRVLNRDVRKLQLPKNRRLGSGAGTAAAQPSSDATRHGRLDTNRDGFVSRGEYLNGRARSARAGVDGWARNNSRRSRLDSRFRSADRNGDGRLSGTELGSLRNRRF